MDKNYNWKDQLAVGKAGEEVVLSWLRERYHVEDFRSDAGMQQDDIDFAVFGGSDKDSFFAEVKTDTYPNQFVFFETHTAEATPGALFKSRARKWYIYKSALGKIIEVEPARVALELWMNASTAQRYPLYPVFNDKKRIRAWGVRLPIVLLEKLGGMVYLLPEANDAADDNA